MKRLAAALLALTACASAQSPGTGRATTTSAPDEAPALAPAEVVRIEVAAGPAVAPGTRGEVRVRLEIAEGYHVMSDRPSDPLYIATRVEVGGGDGVAWGTAIFPAAVSFRLLEDSISTFEGVVDVRVPFEVSADARPGARQATANVTYQACTATNCLFPTTRTAELTLEVTGSP